MTDQVKGLYEKYKIEKSDGAPTDPDARYFVLRVDTDPHARDAVYTYACSVLDDNPRLAKELIELLKDTMG